MKQHKKTWLMLFIVAFMFSCYSVTALATEITPEQVEKAIQQQQAASNAGSAANTPASTPSKPPVSSAKPRTHRRAVSSSASSDPSSDVSGDVSSELISSEASSEIVLPSVNSIVENNPLSSPAVDAAANKKMNWIGILSWACIALGVAVVLIVVLSNRHPPRGGPGRKRYRRPAKSRKKRLLNDKYYRNTKY